MKKILPQLLLAFLIILLSGAWAYAQTPLKGGKLTWKKMKADGKGEAPKKNAVSYADSEISFTIEPDGEITGERYEYTYDNPVSATPSEVKTMKFNYAPRGEVKMDELLQSIEDMGFFYLGSEYGAPEDQRFYPTQVTVTWRGEKKTVIYRSNPSYDGPPSVFERVVEAIKEFAGVE